MGIEKVGFQSTATEISKSDKVSAQHSELPLQTSAGKPPARSLIARMTGYSAQKNPKSELRNLLVRKFGTSDEKKEAQLSRLDRKMDTSYAMMQNSPFRREQQRHQRKFGEYQTQHTALSSTVSEVSSPASPASASSASKDFPLQSWPTPPDPGAPGYGAYT